MSISIVASMSAFLQSMTFQRPLLHADETKEATPQLSFGELFVSLCWAPLLRCLDVRLAWRNSMISLVELTDNCTLRYPAHALYHCRSPYVPMLTALTLHHVIRDGVAWTVGVLILSLVVGNICINVFYKTVYQSFHLLDLPLPAPAIHCEHRLDQQQQNPPIAPPTTRPSPPLTSPLGESTLQRAHISRERDNHLLPHSLVHNYDTHDYNVLTSTSISSSADSLEFSFSNSDGLFVNDNDEYDNNDDDVDDDNTASTVSTAVDNVRTVFGRVLQEICHKVEVCHDH